MATNNIILYNEQELENFAKNFLQYIQNNFSNESIKYIALNGDLGTGKTTLVRNILRQLNYNGKVKSPTYAFLETYEVDNSFINKVHHFDIYRFKYPQMWNEYGFDEYLEPDTLIFIEWPELAIQYLPKPIINLTIRIGLDEERIINY